MKNILFLLTLLIAAPGFGFLSSSSSSDPLKAPLASPTFTGSIKFGNYHIEPCETDSGNSGATKTLDLSTCAAQKSTLTGNVTYTLTNPVVGGAYVIRILSGAGSFTATWPGTVKWSGGTAPTITAIAARLDLINLYWDGTNYYGSFAQNFTP